MRGWGAVALLGIACGGGVEAEQRALAERVDHLQRRLDALERRAAEVEAPAPAPAIAQTSAVAPVAARKQALTIRVEGAVVSIDGVAIAGEQLDAELRRRAAAGATSHVIVESDPSIAHARIVEILDRVRAAGFERLAIAARRSGTGTGTGTEELGP